MKAELGLLHPDTSGVILKEVERSVVVVEMKNRVKNILVEYSKFYNAVKTLWSYVPASLPVVDVKKAWDAIEVIEVHFDRFEKECFNAFIAGSTEIKQGLERDLFEAAGYKNDGVEIYAISKFILGILIQNGCPDNVSKIAKRVIERLNERHLGTPSDLRNEVVACHLESWYDFMSGAEKWSASLVPAIARVFEILPMDEGGKPSSREHINKGISVLCDIGSAEAKKAIRNHQDHPEVSVRKWCENALKYGFQNS